MKAGTRVKLIKGITLNSKGKYIPVGTFGTVIEFTPNKSKYCPAHKWYGLEIEFDGYQTKILCTEFEVKRIRKKKAV